MLHIINAKKLISFIDVITFALYLIAPPLSLTLLLFRFFSLFFSFFSKKWCTLKQRALPLEILTTKPTSPLTMRSSTF